MSSSNSDCKFTVSGQLGATFSALYQPVSGIWLAKCRQDGKLDDPDGTQIHCFRENIMVSRVGFEPTTLGLKVRCSAN